MKPFHIKSVVPQNPFVVGRYKNNAVRIGTKIVGFLQVKPVKWRIRIGYPLASIATNTKIAQDPRASYLRQKRTV